MKKYYVVFDKKISNADDFYKSAACSEDFRVFFDAEVNNKKDLGKDQQPAQYLKIAKKLGFDWQNYGESGQISYDYYAQFILNSVKAYSRELVNNIGFPIYEVSGGNMFNLNHPVVQNYAKLFGGRLYKVKSGNEENVMSYDASYPQFNFASKYRIKEENLPFAHFSISDCYRNEQKGELSLLVRNRRFYMPDLHPYFANIEQAFEWFPKIEDQILISADEGNYEYQQIVDVSSDKYFEQYKAELIKLFGNNKNPVLLCVLDDDSPKYWVINADYKIIDKKGQSVEIACIQVDIGNAKILGIEYECAGGAKQNPVIIHAAIPGGIERYIYALIDDFRKRFPIWLYPIQLRLIPVSQQFISDCLGIAERLRAEGIRAEVDDRDVNLSKKIKLSHEDLVYKEMIIGKKELENFSLIDKEVQIFKEKIMKHLYVKEQLPILISKQVR